ncbi:hypothetical protein Q3G72_024455 [Acer saccharum]|nr:hypothetical protein Q3G72_024455 [Acer saccharum]
MAQSLWFLFIITNLVFSAYADQLQRFEHPTKTHDSLSFLVLGDWGRRGDFNQSQVALQMGRIGEKLDIDFVVSTGDNFYEDGLTGENDSNFEESFSNIYTANSLQKQWYSVLGNHDYRGDVLAQLSPFLRKIDSRWLCLRSFIVDTELAEIFFVDTTPFVKMYFTNEAGHKYDWRGINSRKAYISNLLKDLDLALKESTAKWKIVIGHHAIRSIGHHGDTQELIKNILPLLKIYGVDFYMNGHDHCLEHISDTESPIEFLTSGAGSKAWRGDINEKNRVSGELPRFEQPVKADGSLSFLVVGDWGRRGAFNQSQVAFQMGRIGEDLNVDFVVSSGDNFYDNGLRRTNDPFFKDSFSKIYTANSLKKQWYSVLGNHDYRGDVEAQLSPMLRLMDPRWLCLRSFIVNTEIVELFFVDTTPFVDKYFLKPKKHHYDWRGVIPRNNYLTKLLKDLESALKSSVAKWKIVIGHHAIRSVGHHGDTKELIHQILPILEANNVDFYINGHDHCLQHISSSTSPIQFLTSGGGSKAWRGVIDYDQLTKDETKFYYDGQGFMSVELNQAQANIKFYNVFGQVLHTLNFSDSNHLRAAADDSFAIATY